MKPEALKRKLRELSQKYKPVNCIYEKGLETFIWQGVFEGKKAEYRRTAGLIQLMLRSSHDALTIQYFRCPGLKRSHFLSRLPDAVYLNNRLLLLAEILHKSSLKDVENILKIYLEGNKTVEITSITARIKEKIKTLFSCYQTFNRFIRYLQKEYLEFYAISETHKGKTLNEILDKSSPKKKSSPLQILQEELREAVVLENYERAAILLDKIKKLKVIKRRRSKNQR